MLTPTIAHADDSKLLVRLAAGEQTQAWGVVVMANAPSLLLLVLSRRAVTVAVFEGSIMLGNHRGQSGEALVTTLESGMTRRVRFDARRLAVTLPGKWRGEAIRVLDATAVTDGSQ